MSAAVDMRQYSRKPFLDRALPYMIIAPALIITIGILYPFVSAIYYSLTNYSFLRQTYKLVWGRNWANMLTEVGLWDGIARATAATVQSSLSLAVVAIYALIAVYARVRWASAWSTLWKWFAVVVVALWCLHWTDVAGNPDFWHAVWVTCKYAFWSTGSEMVLGLGIGLPAAAVYASVSLYAPGGPLELFALALSVLTAPWLSLAYAAWAMAAFDSVRGGSVARALAPAGRMALSNYLLQSLVCAWLFTGYGLGGMGQVSPPACVAIASAVFAAQLWLSACWLRRHAYGPVEWLLRALTLGRWPRLRKLADEPR